MKQLSSRKVDLREGEGGTLKLRLIFTNSETMSDAALPQQVFLNGCFETMFAHSFVGGGGLSI